LIERPSARALHFVQASGEVVGNFLIVRCRVTALSRVQRMRSGITDGDRGRPALPLPPGGAREVPVPSDLRTRAGLHPSRDLWAFRRSHSDDSRGRFRDQCARSVGGHRPCTRRRRARARRRRCAACFEFSFDRPVGTAAEHQNALFPRCPEPAAHDLDSAGGLRAQGDASHDLSGLWIECLNSFGRPRDRQGRPSA
jgi:hypothetical protein